MQLAHTFDAVDDLVARQEEGTYNKVFHASVML
jgi:hypothetical protein